MYPFFFIHLSPSPSSYRFFHHVAYYFNLLFQPASLTYLFFPKHLYRLSYPLPHPLVFQPFRQLFPFFLDSLPFHWQFFRSFGHCFDHLVCLPHKHLLTSRPLLPSRVFFNPLFNSSPTSYIHFTSTGKFFQFFGPFFQPMKYEIMEYFSPMLCQNIVPYDKMK